MGAASAASETTVDDFTTTTATTSNHDVTFSATTDVSSSACLELRLFWRQRTFISLW